MKKSLAILLLILVCIMAACSDKTSPVQTNPTVAKPTRAEITSPEITAPFAPTETDSCTDQTEETPVPAQPEETAPPVTEPVQTSQPTEPELSNPAKQPPETQPTETQATQQAATEPVKSSHSHSYAEAYFPSICGEWAYWEHRCSCGDSYTELDTSVPPNDHNYAFTYAPKEDSIWSRYCTVICKDCGEGYTTTVAVEKVPAEILDQIELLTIQYLNDYRQADGTSFCDAPPVFQEVANFRANQLLDDFSHNTQKLREACAAYEYGRFVDATEFGDDASLSYYSFGPEAIAKGFTKGSIEDTARSLAKQIHESEAHWEYIGDSRYTCIAVGIAYRPGNIVAAIFVSEDNYG